ncbi:type II secretion system minor pseudopilin GspK [Paludibacterium paludis]|uniref:Type II secretion system protein K n=1 Tax=Paludibacterium paludis TaxID=1225769 RepID=A0A918NZB7_9NEIS|nr:type II secretion system minor pseudopilin GspK [Paludibacterium paludis]GGY08103.1 type II secretion system protein K [Paludibacterium paludis]
MKKSQKGMAVVIALLLVALAASASALMLWQQHLWWRQVEEEQTRAQVREVTRAGITWAVAVLQYNRMTSPVVYPGQLWAQPMPETEAQGVKVSGTLTDMQGRFNLNALGTREGVQDPLRVAQFRRLLAQLHLPLSLSNALMNHMQLRVGDASQEGGPPALSANWLERLDMLRWVTGFTPEVIARLEPYVTVLPQSVNRINVNTAPVPLLKALMPDVDPGMLEAQSRQRVVNYFVNVADFINRVKPDAERDRVKDWASTDSGWFRLESRVKQGRIVLATRAMVKVDPSEGGARVIWRQDGVGALPRQETHDNNP